MKLETAHKVLIGTAICFFALYGVFEIVRWRGGGGGSALARAAFGLAAAAVFSGYLRAYVRGQKRPHRGT